MDFKTKGDITLRPGDLRVGHSFDISKFIPSTTDATSVSCVVYDSDSTDVTSYIVYGSPSLANDIITVNLSYSESTGNGRYKLVFTIGYNDTNNPTRICIFHRLYLEEL